MTSAFGKIIGKDKLDAKSVTPVSAQNADWEANRPQNAPYITTSPWNRKWLDMSSEKHFEQVRNSRRKRGE